MGISLEWDNPEKTAVRWDFDARWDWEDMYVTRTASMRLVQSVPHTVDIILNMERSATLPGNVIPHMNTVLTRTSNNAGRFIFVRPNLFLMAVIKLALRVIPVASKRVLVVNTLDEARAAVNHRRV